MTMNPSDKSHVSRRALLEMGVACIATLSAPVDAAVRQSTDVLTEDQHPLPLRLGIATYSLAEKPTDEVIEILQALRIANAGLFKTHCPWSGTAEECRAVGLKFQRAGIAVSGSGVIALPSDEARIRQAFENARAANLATMVCKPDPQALPLVEAFVRQYDMTVAIHNHGPEDSIYPSPHEVWKAVSPYDRRIGLCIDVGHTSRAGFDPASVIRQYRERLYDVHLKDSLAAAGALRDVPTEVGAGRLDIHGILAALIAIKYSGVVAFEYEKRGKDAVIGLAESVGYVRGVLTGMAKRA